MWKHRDEELTWRVEQHGFDSVTWQILYPSCANPALGPCWPLLHWARLVLWVCRYTTKAHLYVPLSYKALLPKWDVPCLRLHFTLEAIDWGFLMEAAWISSHGQYDMPLRIWTLWPWILLLALPQGCWSSPLPPATNAQIASVLGYNSISYSISHFQ